MLNWLRAQAPRGRRASKLYGSIVTAARREPFYVGYGVPDTPEGRFAMIVVHMIPVLERLQQEGEEGADLGRALNEVFVTDMDDYLREIGVGDLSVPRHVKKAAGALYECVRDYRAALQHQGHEQLEEVLKRVLLPDAEAAAPSVAAYLREVAGLLAAQPANALLSGEVSFPPA